VISALGDWHNGWASYLVAGRPTVAISLFGDVVRLAGSEPLAAGRRRIEVLYRRTARGGGPIALCVDGATVARATVPIDLPFRWQIGGTGLLVGRDRGFPVSDEYQPPAEFTGQIDKVVLDALLLLPRDVQAEIEALLRHE